LTLRFIKNDAATFKVEGTGFVILFLLGQMSLALMFRRIYGL
jgi:hypothetical protein